MIADYDEAICRDPSDAKAYFARGNAWLAKNDFDKALADYGETIRLDPKNASAFHGRASVWLAKEDHGRVLADIQQLIRLDPKNATAHDGHARAAYISRTSVWAFCALEPYLASLPGSSFCLSE